MKRMINIVICGIFIFQNVIEIKAKNSLFQTGQEAEVILGPYAVKSNASDFHHPSRAMSDGKRFYVADTRNNRILIWNSIPVSNNQPADVIVGQPEFTTNNSGAGASGLNWPVGVYSDSVRLFIADTENGRVLIWNEIPTTNGEPADIVLGQVNFDIVGEQPVSPSSIQWPWDVLFDGERLYVVCTGSGRVLIWNSLPSYNNQPADLVLGKKDLVTGFTNDRNSWGMSTPRAVATDGHKLAVSDYNLKRILVWNTIPNKNGQEADIVLLQKDFTSMDNSQIDFGHGGLYMHDGKLFLAGNSCVYLWEQSITTNNQSPDRIIGDAGFSRGSGLWGVSYDGQNLYVSDSNGARVLIYNHLPQDSSIPADLVLGQPDFETNIFLGRSGIRSNRGIASTGRKLFISGYDGRIVIHQNIPEKDEAEADNFIGMTDFDGNRTLMDIGECVLWTDGIRLVALSRQYGVYIWNCIPEQDNERPDRILFPNGTCGSINIVEPQGIAVNGDQLFISDTGNKRILIWNSIPSEGDVQEPDIIVNIDSSPYGISTDGERLAVSGFSSGILLWNTIPDKDDQPPDVVLSGHPYGFNIPQGVFVSDDRVFVSDTGFDRIVIYNSFPVSNDQEYDVVLGQEDLTSRIAGKGRDKLNMPWGIWFDGEILWVAEFKFADRVLGYKATIDPVSPYAPSDLKTVGVSNFQINLSWNDNSDNERGFIIEYKKSDEASYNIFGYGSVNVESCIITGLEKNTMYSFLVSAYNSYGTSLTTGPVEASTLNEENTPPEVPYNPEPQDGANGIIESRIYLQWSSGDPDAGDAVSYDLYFGTVSEPPLYEEDLSTNHYEDHVHQLAGNTQYYWKIIAKDLNGAQTEGPIWSFSTLGVPGIGCDLIIFSDKGGTTNPYTGNYYYNKDASVLVYAIPDTGYLFSEWSGDVSPDLRYDNPLSMTLSNNHSITAKFSLTSVDKEKDLKIVGDYAVFQNFPNPFNPYTIIRYQLPAAGRVSLVICNILGQRIRNLVDKNQNSGQYEIVWNAKDDMGQFVGAGVYICRIIIRYKGKIFVDSKKLVLCW
jgi:hypothetical protein